MWLRDLTEEGIEPHPGPTQHLYYSKNCDGIADPVHREAVFRAVSRAHVKEPLAAVFLQETNLRAHMLNAAKARALEYGLLLFAATIPDRVGTKGGTAILIPTSMMQTTDK